MKNLLLALLLVFAFNPLAAIAQEADSAASKKAPLVKPLPATAAASAQSSQPTAEESPQKKNLFIAIFSLGPSWQKDKPAHEQAHFAEHSNNLQQLRAEKKILLGARYADKGMIILSAADEPEARAWLEHDPMVVNRVFTLELHPFHPFYYGSIEKQ